MVGGVGGDFSQTRLHCDKYNIAEVTCSVIGSDSTLVYGGSD